MRVLVVEDDEETAAYVARGLREHGHTVDVAADGRAGLLQASTSTHDVLVLDRRLPILDGVSLLETVRRAGVRTPALFLSAMDSIEDRVQGLKAGDDYLVKPFAFAEFYARVCALARRPPLHEAETVLQVGDLEMDLIRRTVTRAGTPIDLKPTEFRLLEYLVRHSGRVVTRTMLLESVWQFHFDPRTNIVETHISRLRAKVDRGFDRELITTVRGFGYQVS